MSNSGFEEWAADEIARIQTGTTLRRPSDHQSMFKYIDLNSKTPWNLLQKTLRKFELAGANAIDMNDPFELSPVVFDDLQASTIADAVSYNPLLQRLQGNAPKSVKDAFPDAEPYRRQARFFLDDVVARYRIIAFCERSDSGLLWSHYANSYQGACLQFLAKGFRWKRHYTLGYVNYSKYRPTYPLSLALSLSAKTGAPRIPVNSTPLKRAESEKILFFTKAEDWAYESEIRLVYDFTEYSSAVFREDSLVSIIIGPRFSAENKRRLAKLIKDSYYKDLPIRRARLSNTTFSVEIIE